jgi:hypothetical protein
MGFYIIDPHSANHASQIGLRGRYRHASSILSPSATPTHRCFPAGVRFGSPTKPPRNRRLKHWLQEYQLRRRLIKLQRGKQSQIYHQSTSKMSSPYVYSPSTPLQYPNQYQQTPYFYHSPRSSTPFIPDASLYHSPYSNPNSLPGTPHIRSSGIPAGSTPNTPGVIPFPSSGYDGGYGPSWEDIMRQRRPSWHGVGPEQFLQPAYPAPPGYNRRHSFGATGYQQPQYGDWSQLQGGLLSPNAYFSQSFHVNPWINAEAPRADFHFDLSIVSFLPLRLYGPGQSAPLTPDQLQEPATYPSLTKLRIIHEMIPQWPIDLQFNGYNGSFSPNPYQAGPPPITLVDVLVAIHRSLHLRISHADWARLGSAQEMEVGKAYTRRCKAVGSMVDQERAQGVKRVDFLLTRTRMLGLVRGGTVDGWDVMRLITTDR